MQSCAARRFAVAVSLLLATAAGVRAEEAVVGTVRLRGGYDANPTGMPGDPEGTAFITIGAAVALGRGDDDGKIAFAAEGQRTEFNSSDIAPATQAKLRFETETRVEDWTLRTGTRLDATDTYDLRALNVVQSVKLRPAAGALRPFVTGALRYSTLNETNILFADFLPEPQRFVRAAATPGLAVVHGRLEFGASVAFSSTHYIGEADPLGFDRDNTRIQPFLFATYKEDGLRIDASVSRFNGTWRDDRYPHVQQTLYDLSVGKTFGDFKLDLTARRSVEDTTFPFVPVTLLTRTGVTLSYKATPRLTLRVSANQSRTDYLGLPLSATTMAYGIGGRYDYGEGWVLGLDAARIDGTLINGEPMESAVVSFSLSKAFKLADAGDPAQQRWATLPPPTGH